MLSARRILPVVLMVLTSWQIVAVSSPAGASPGDCHFDPGTGQLVCEVEETDPGTTVPPTTQPEEPPPSQGGNGGDPGDGGGPGDGNGGPTQYETPRAPCLSGPYAVVPQPPPGDPAWEGHTTGTVMYCEGDLNGVPFTYWQDNAAPPAPPVDREGLARHARALITLPRMEIGVGPDRTHVAIKYWAWLWLTPAGSTDLSNTQTDRGISVTVTGRPESVTWSPGEPTHCVVGHPEQPCDNTTPAASFTCDGLGQAPPEGTSSTATPPCGYKYNWRASAERTGGAKVWTATATVRWRFSWATTGAGPAVGAATGTWTEDVPAGATSFYVGQWVVRNTCLEGTVACPGG